MIPVDLSPEVAAAILLVACASLILLTCALIAHDGGKPRYIGRHHEDTVEIVPLDWMPPVGARRLAEFVDTQQMEPIRDEVAQ